MKMPTLGNKQLPQTVGTAPANVTATVPAKIPRLVCAVAVVATAQFLLIRSYAIFRAEVSQKRSSDLIDRGQYAQARVLGAQAVAAYPYNGYALFRWGASQSMAAKTPQEQIAAESTLNRALRYMPHTPNVLRMLGEALFQRARYADAATALDRYFRMVPTPKVDPAQLHRVRAVAKFRSNNFGEAAVAFTEASQYADNRLQLFVPWLINSLVLNQTQTAESMLRTLASQDPGRSLSESQMKDLFEVATARGKLVTLIDILSAATRMPNADPALSKFLAVSLVRAGRSDEALKMLTRLRHRTPEDPDLPLFIGDIEFKKRNVKVAREQYREHLRLLPDSPFRHDIHTKIGEL